MTPEVVNSWFTPFHYFVYLGTLFVSMVVFYQWKWTKTCRDNVLVLVVRSDGSSKSQLAPKTGGEVSLKTPQSNTIKMWPINKLSTIDVLYPGVGFVPQFLQKQIRMVIVDEDDWEPLINRDPNKSMIASPAVLGNLMHEKITEAVITVNKEMLDSIAGLIKRLNKLVNPTIVYIGLGMILLLVVFVVYQVIPVVGQVEELADSLKAIQKALGVVTTSN